MGKKLIRRTSIAQEVNKLGGNRGKVKKEARIEKSGERDGKVLQFRLEKRKFCQGEQGTPKKKTRGGGFQRLRLRYTGRGKSPGAIHPLGERGKTKKKKKKKKPPRASGSRKIHRGPSGKAGGERSSGH